MSILTYEKEEELLAPIKEYVGKIQAEIDALREDGTTKATRLQHQLRNMKNDRTLSKEERVQLRRQDEAALVEAKRVQAANRSRINELVAKAEKYIDENFDKQYLNEVELSVEAEKKEAKAEYQRQLALIKKEHEQAVAELRKNPTIDLKQELKDEEMVFKNKQYDAKVSMQHRLQAAKIGVMQQSPKSII